MRKIDFLLRCAALLAVLGVVTSPLAGCEALRVGAAGFNEQMAHPGYGRVYDCRGGCVVEGPVYRRY